MKIVLTCLLMFIAIPAAAQSLQDCYNNIGVFNVPDPNLDALAGHTWYCGGPGAFTVYVVLINAYNENTGQLIETVGGFEFRLEIAPGVLATPQLPPGVANLAPFPDLFCTANLPVAANRCVLLALELGVFTVDPSYIFVTPVSPAMPQSIPGEVAVTDAGDEFSLSRAAPLFLSYDQPVFKLFDCWGPIGEKSRWDDCWVVPNEPATWGGLKALYR